MLNTDQTTHEYKGYLIQPNNNDGGYLILAPNSAFLTLSVKTVRGAKGLITRHLSREVYGLAQEQAQRVWDLYADFAGFSECDKVAEAITARIENAADPHAEALLIALQKDAVSVHALLNPTPTEETTTNTATEENDTMPNTEDTTQDYARDQAAAQVGSIIDLVAALECDYDRLEELRDDRAALQDTLDEARETVDAFHETDEDNHRAEALTELQDAQRELNDWDEENAGELQQLQAEAGECENEDDARERIQEDPLCVDVRSDWASAGDELTASEYRIVLCTGGPHVELIGYLDEHNQPHTARVMYQDWGTPETEFFGDVSTSTLLAYANVFYFGA